MYYKLIMQEHLYSSGYNAFIINDKSKKVKYLTSEEVKEDYKFLVSNKDAFNKLPMFAISGGKYVWKKAQGLVEVGIDFYDGATTLYCLIESPYIDINNGINCFKWAYNFYGTNLYRSELPYEVANIIVEGTKGYEDMLDKLARSMCFECNLPESCYEYIDQYYFNTQTKFINWCCAPNRVYCSGIDELRLFFDYCLR